MIDTKQAALEYLLRNQRAYRLVARGDGFFEPPANDRCPLCKDARWSSSSGAHLKTVEHTALKYGIKPKEILDLVNRIDKPGPSDVAWKAVSYAESSYLRSGTNGFVWLPGEVTEAKCSDTECEVPGEDCSCGLYFFWSPIDALEYYGDVVIRCKIGGKVIEATKGCKAQAAVITGILASEDPERDAWLAEQYNVPIINDIFEDVQYE